MRTVDVGNEDLFAAFVCDFALRGINERGKRDAKKDRNNEASWFRSAHGRKARVLDQAFQIFPVSGHSINRIFLFAGGAAEKKNFVVVSQTPSQPKCFLGVSLVAFWIGDRTTRAPVMVRPSFCAPILRPCRCSEAKHAERSRGQKHGNW